MPRDYAVVLPSFWTGSTGRELRALGRDVQLAALYLVTAPHSNMIGLYHLALPTLVHETGLSEEGAFEALRSLGDVGFALYDGATEVVWVVEMARVQVLQGADGLKAKDKRVKGVQNELLRYRKCPFYAEFIAHYREAFHLADMPPAELPRKPLRRSTEGASKPQRSQDQDQEQDQVLAGSRGRAREAAPSEPATPVADCRTERGGLSGANVGAPGSPCAPRAAEPPEPPRGAGEGGDVQRAAPRRARPAPRFDDDLPVRKLVIEDLTEPPHAPPHAPPPELDPLGADLRARFEAALGHGVVVAAAGEEPRVRDGLEAFLAEPWVGVERAAEFLVDTALLRRRRPGGEPSSMAWCLKLLRESFPRPREKPSPPVPAGSPEWARLRLAARKRMKPEPFDRWIANLGGMRVEDDLVLYAPAAGHRDFVTDNYLGWLQELAAEEFVGDPLTVRIEFFEEAPEAASGGAR